MKCEVGREYGQLSARSMIGGAQMHWVSVESWRILPLIGT